MDWWIGEGGLVGGGLVRDGGWVGAGELVRGGLVGWLGEGW